MTGHRRPARWWLILFLAVTAAAVGLELVAVATGPAAAPWTHLLADYVPAPVTMAATAVLVTWLPIHFIRAYRHRRRGRPG